MSCPSNERSGTFPSVPRIVRGGGLGLALSDWADVVRGEPSALAAVGGRARVATTTVPHSRPVPSRERRPLILTIPRPLLLWDPFPRGWVPPESNVA